MSTRRRGLPPLHQAQAFTLFDEMQASPTEPMPAPMREARLQDARYHLSELVSGAAPTRLNWKVMAMIGNIFEVMVELKVVNDEEDLVYQSQVTLKAAAEYALDHDVPPRLTVDEAHVLGSLIDAYGEVLAALPHRETIRVLRETDKRVRVRRPGDYDANPAKRKKRT